MQFIELLELLLSGEVITTNRLLSLGYDLDNDNLFKIKKEGIFLNVNEFIKKGIFYCLNGDVATAKRIVEVCKKNKPSSNSVALFDLYISLIEENKDEYKEKLDILEKTSSTERQRHNSLYFAILVDYLLDIPVEMGHKKVISLDDIFSRETKGALELNIQNIIRRKVFYNQFLSAKESFDSVPKNKNKLLEDIVHKKLIDMVSAKNMEFRDRVCYYIEKEMYNKAIALLEGEDKKCGLSLEEKYALKVCLQIRNIIETNLLPTPIQLKKRDHLYSDIEHQNYQQAFDLYQEIFGVQENSPLYYSLKKITALIRKKSNGDFANIIDIIYKGNYEALIISLKKYGLSSYYDLIKDYVRLGKYENDFTFHETISVLYQMIYADFSFDFSYYMNLFYSAIESNDELYSRLYLKMIVHADLNKDYCDFISSAEELYQERFNRKFIAVGNYGVQVINKFCDLRDGKYVLCNLKNCYEDRRVQTEELLARNKDMRGDYVEEKNSMVLTYSPYMKCFNPLPVVTQANDYYKALDYEKAAECYRKLIMFGKPMPYIYGRYGTSLYNLGVYKEAYDVLDYTISLYKKDNNYNKDTEYYERLLGLIRIKAGDNIILYDRQDNVDTLFDKYPFISEMQLLTNSFPLDEACEKLDLNDEELQLFYIICARDSYILNEFDEGDYYISLVDPQELEDREVKNLYYEIKDNKIFYSRRYQDDSKKILFKK